jgi:DNA-binding PadR family transcriptional regulator
MLPDITHLQFLVLMILLDGEKSGREVREELAEHGVKKSGPAFYQIMARLEDDKYVKGWYVEKVIDGQRIKERRYEITSAGVRACEHVRVFMADALRGWKGGLANA